MCRLSLFVKILNVKTKKGTQCSFSKFMSEKLFRLRAIRFYITIFLRKEKTRHTHTRCSREHSTDYTTINKEHNNRESFLEGY